MRGADVRRAGVWLSLIKVVAIVAMIAGGAYVIFFGFTSSASDGEAVRNAATGISNLWSHGGWVPNGIEGFVAAFAVVMFAFGGVEIVGLTAAEAQHPERTIPRAINTVPARILVFYVGTMFVLMSIFPWNEITGKSSPLVQIFGGLGVSSAANILNVVVITAAVSAINSDLFGAARMMYGLSKHRHAPEVLGGLSKAGVPVVPVLVMLAAMLGGVVLHRFYPEGLFFMVAAMATFATVWVWLTILLSHYAMRRKMSPAQQKALSFPVPGWPVAPLLAIAFLALTIVLLGVSEASRPALYGGALWICAMAGIYLLFVRDREIPLTTLAEVGSPRLADRR